MNLCKFMSQSVYISYCYVFGKGGSNWGMRWCQNTMKTSWLVCMLWQVNGCWCMYIFVWPFLTILKVDNGLLLFFWKCWYVVWFPLFGLGPLLILNVVSRPTAVSEHVLPNKGNNRLNVICFCSPFRCELKLKNYFKLSGYYPPSQDSVLNELSDRLRGQ